MKDKIYPNVLVISHNAFSTTSNMGKTIATFFNEWDTDNIAQIYFHSEIPNSNVCNNFFRITDVDMVKSIIKIRKPGKIIDENDIDLSAASTRIDKGIVSNIYEIGRKKKPYMYLLRDLLWASNNWQTKELTNWINEFRPEILFYAAGDSIFSMKIALKIAKDNKIPMVVYIGDDYYYKKPDNSFLAGFNLKRYQENFQEVFSYLSFFLTASDKMQRKYTDEFRRNGYAIMTSTNIDKPKKSFNQTKISYIGNLGLDRWKPLVEIGRYLKAIGLRLDVYSGEKDKNITSQLTCENGIKFYGIVSADEVEEIIASSTLIVHVESMNKYVKEWTRYSMSTKIGESLGSGVCLFAYGPEDIASIEYLKDNDVACVVTNKSELKYNLYEIIENQELRNKYINKAHKLAVERHNLDTNTRLFHEMIVDTYIKNICN